MVRQPEGPAQRIALRCGQPVDQRHPRLDQQMQPRERQLRLGLDPGTAHRGDPLRRRIIQERRLADPRLPTQHQRPTAARPCLLEKPIDLCLFGFSSMEHLPTVAVGYGDVRSDVEPCHSPFP